MPDCAMTPSAWPLTIKANQCMGLSAPLGRRISCPLAPIVVLLAWDRSFVVSILTIVAVKGGEL